MLSQSLNYTTYYNKGGCVLCVGTLTGISFPFSRCFLITCTDNRTVCICRSITSYGLTGLLKIGTHQR